MITFVIIKDAVFQRFILENQGMVAMREDR